MDWEANLAAIIRCTDENLQQHFQNFADMSMDFADLGSTTTAAATTNNSTSYSNSNQQQEGPLHFASSPPVYPMAFGRQGPSRREQSGGFPHPRAPATTHPFSRDTSRKAEQQEEEEYAAEGGNNQHEPRARDAHQQQHDVKPRQYEMPRYHQPDQSPPVYSSVRYHYA